MITKSIFVYYLAIVIVLMLGILTDKVAISMFALFMVLFLIAEELEKIIIILHEIKNDLKK